MMETLLLGLGLVLVIEGLVYALAPSFIEDMLAVLKSMPLDQRRLMGLAALALGVVLIWAARALGAG